MKRITLAFLLVVLGVTQARFDWEKAENDFNKCKAETNAKETFEETIKQNKNPETHEGKCLLECLLKTKGIYDKNGKYSPSGTLKYFSDVFSHKPELVQKVVDDAAACDKIGLKTADKCEIAFERLKCASARYDVRNINTQPKGKGN